MCAKKSSALGALDLAFERIRHQVEVPEWEFNAIWRDMIQDAEAVAPKLAMDEARLLLIEHWPPKAIPLVELHLYQKSEQTLKVATDVYRKDGLTAEVQDSLAKFGGLESGIKNLADALDVTMERIRRDFVALACLMTSLPILERRNEWPKDLFLEYNRIDAMRKEANRLRNEIFPTSSS